MKKILAIVVALAMGGSALHAQKYGKTPEDSIKCLQNLSVYQEFYKQKNYTGAYDAWKQVLELCPATSLNTYIRGNTILKQMIAATKDPAQRGQYFDAPIQRRTHFYHIRSDIKDNGGLLPISSTSVDLGAFLTVPAGE